jgi:conjugal transfer/entry exclusion protein
MENQRLNKQLQDLQTQLQQAKTLEQNDREALLQLVKDIQATLARTGKAEEYESAVQRLEDAVQRFEVAHPQMTAAMARVINSLSNMGI